MPAILAFLKVIPVKDWIYGAVIALLLAGFGWYTVHERHEGAAKILAADKKLVDAVAAKDQIIHDNAQLELVNVGNHEKIALAAPPIANAGLVCHSPGRVAASASSGDVPQPTDKSGAVPAGGFDPSGAILTLLRDSDAQVNGLIESNEILEGYIEALRLTK
jgi:hypothetical protein